MTWHKHSIHIGVRYSCDQCEYKANIKCDLTKHQLSIHRVVRYSCDQYAYKATTHIPLTQHQQSKHMGVINYWKVKSSKKWLQLMCFC